MSWTKLTEKEHQLVSEIAKKRCDHSLCAPPCGGSAPCLSLRLKSPVANDPQSLEFVRRTLFSVLGGAEFVYQINGDDSSFRYFLKKDNEKNVFRFTPKNDQTIFMSADFSEGCKVSPTSSSIWVFGRSSVALCDSDPASNIISKKLF